MVEMNIENGKPHSIENKTSYTFKKLLTPSLTRVAGGLQWL